MLSVSVQESSVSHTKQQALHSGPAVAQDNKHRSWNLTILLNVGCPGMGVLPAHTVDRQKRFYAIGLFVRYVDIRTRTAIYHPTKRFIMSLPEYALLRASFICQFAIISPVSRSYFLIRLLNTKVISCVFRNM